jgi:iron complex transport system ATP-binding protein
MTLIKKLSMDQQLTVVAVLHDLNIAAAYSDYIIMMKNGEVNCQGLPVETFTKENITNVFNIDVDVEVSAHTNKPYIYTIKRHEIKKNNIKVHVICGGGSGSEIIASLHNSGFEVSAGVLSIGDLDWKISKDFELKVAEDIPFTRISEDAYATNKKLAEAADYVVVTDFYIGKANIRNIELLTEPALENKPILLLGEESLAQRDITEGAAIAQYNKMKQRKSSIAVTREEMYSILNHAGAANE